jgi:toxin ParE1/3/4
MKPERVIHKTGLATADIYQLADHYLENAGLAIALRFVNNAERAFNQLLDWVRCSDWSDFRMRI